MTNTTAFLIVDNDREYFLITTGDGLHSWTSRPEHATQFPDYLSAMNAAHRVGLTTYNVFGPVIHIEEV